MIPPDQFRDHIIRPVLFHLSKTDKRLGSRAAENLLLGTALMESRLKHLEQIRGPALSMFGFEPTTFDDTYDRYLWIERRDLYAAVNGFVLPAYPARDQLAGNQLFACALARIKYWMAPEPLPEHDDIDGLAGYWKRIYNAGGRGTPDRWAAVYRKYVP